MLPDLIENRYRVLEPLGLKSAPSRSYLALDTIQGLQVVIKPFFFNESEGMGTELYQLRQLRHPNLIQIIDVITYQAQRYWVLTYAPGVDFLTWAAMDRNPRRICMGVAAILRGLHYLHSRSLVYRHLQPNRIRIDAGQIGALPAVKLTNLEQAVSSSRLLLSSPVEYLAPEILAGEPPAPAADLYSLGVLLFVGLFDRLPNPQLSPLSQDVVVPEGVSDTPLGELLLGLLSPLPEERPSMPLIWEGLSLASNHVLPISLEELKSAYLPSSSVLLGRDSILQRLQAAICQVKSGAAIALHFTGCGKSTMVDACVFMAKLVGLKTITTNAPASLLASPNSANISSDRFERLVTQFIDSLVEEARHYPCLIAIDGCPSLSDDPLALMLMQQLLHVITQKSATGLLFLWTGELLGDQFERIEHLKLDYLHDEHVKEMVQGMLYMLDPPLWRDQVYQATGGDPRLIVELVHAQIEAGLPDTFELPEERSCLVEQRLAALSPTERKLLAVVAHTPRPLSLPLLKAVDSDILSALPTLLRKGYLALDFLGSYYPTSLYIRRAAQGFLSGKALIRLHQHFCDVLQAEAHPNRMVLGHHLLWAGDVHQGAKMLLQVAFPLVEDLERATALLPREDELLVEIWRYLAQHTRARGDLPRALAIADTLKHEHSEAAILLRAEILLDTGYPGTALQILDEVVAPTSQHYLLSARAHFLQEHYALSVQAIKASKAADGLDLPSRLQLDHLASLCLIYSGQITEALKALDAAIQSANELDLPDMLARLLNSRGIAFQRLGRWNEAMEAYRLALNVVEKTGELSFAAHYMLNMGMLAHQRMELEDALHYYRKAKQLAARCSIGNIRAAALAGEANLLLLFGALAEAEACLDQAEAVAVKAGAMTQLGHIHLYRAEYWLLLERLEQAESYCRLAGECFSTSNELAQTATDLIASEISLKRQELATGKEILDRLLRRIAWDNPDRWRAHRLLALIALAEQEPQLKEAALELELSHALARRTQNSERIWEIYALLASINQRLGQEEKATFYARCFYLAVDLLRRQIPVAYRTWMGQRKDIQQANVLVESIGNVSPQASPSLKELQRLLDINQNLTRRIPSEVLYTQILDSAIELTEAERGVILLQNQADLEIVAAFPADSDTEGSISDTYNNTIARQAIIEERTIVAANIVDDGQLKTLIDLDQEPLRAAICIPLRIRGKVCGVLYLDHRYQPNIFQQKHLRLAESFAVQVGIVLESSHLQQEEAEQRQALAEAKAQVEHLNQQLINQVARQSQELQTISERLRTEGDELVRKYREAKIVGQSKAMKELYLKLDRIAEADLPVLIYGESGTGKELIARAIHYTSARQEEPFVAVNCAAIPQALLESELFGHKKGAFTGALRDRPGLFEVAGRGTLFLDEIGEMPLGMQSKLLRVLQEGTFRRIGDEREGTARCRILSATNKNLEDLVADKQFREDLYYRINVFRLELPPLRERREDIPFLIQHILSTVSKKVAVSPAAMTNLLDFDWPGNVRQLENELLRAAFLCEGTIEPTILNLPTSEKIGDRLRSLTLQEAVQEAARDFERQFIQRALEEENFNVSATAKRLGLHRVGLHKKIRALGIHRPKDSI